MTTVYPITPDERRFAKALRIAEGAGSWTTLWADAGATVYRIPSQSEPAVSYETDGRGCSCPDYLGRVERGGPGDPCKHATAAQLHAARATDVQLSAYDDTQDPAACRRAICADC